MNRRQFLKNIGIASLLVAVAPIVKFVTPEKKETASFRSMILELMEHAETEGIKGWEERDLIFATSEDTAIYTMDGGMTWKKYVNQKPGAFWEIEQGL